MQAPARDTTVHAGIIRRRARAKARISGDKPVESAPCRAVRAALPPGAQAKTSTMPRGAAVRIGAGLLSASPLAWP
ncbi:MAG: hypothetical protein WAQ05_19345, partial [Rubrivivax sp.]